MYKLHCEIGIDEYILNLLKLWKTNGWLLRYGLNKFQPRKMHILIDFTRAQTFVQTAIIGCSRDANAPFCFIYSELDYVCMMSHWRRQEKTFL